MGAGTIGPALARTYEGAPPLNLPLRSGLKGSEDLGVKTSSNLRPAPRIVRGEDSRQQENQPQVDDKILPGKIHSVVARTAADGDVL